MAFLSDIEQVRSIEWGRSFLWDVKFVQPIVPPDPFNSWFPALDIEENVAVVESHTIEAYNTSIKIPRKTGPKELRLTFVDDINHTLFNWFEEWMNEKILNNGYNVAPLSEAARKIHISKLDNKRREISQSIYLVYPDGPLQFTGNSSSDPLSYSISFQIVGKESSATNGGYTSNMRARSGSSMGKLTQRDVSNLRGDSSYAISDITSSVFGGLFSSKTKETESTNVASSTKATIEKQPSN